MRPPKTKPEARHPLNLIWEPLFLIFLVLKLVGVDPVTSWSWWWVTAPLWGGFVINMALLLALRIVFGPSSDEQARARAVHSEGRKIIARDPR